MARDVFGFHVSRVCRIRGEATTDDLSPLTGGAFRPGHEELVTEEDELGKGALAMPHVVSAFGAMVVLGEPGAGKTSVLRDLTEGMAYVENAWDGSSHACLWISGADLTEGSYDEELGNHLEALPQAGEDTGHQVDCCKRLRDVVALVGEGLAAVEPFGVASEEDFDAITSSLGDLGGVSSCCELRAVSLLLTAPAAETCRWGLRHSGPC